MKQLEDSVLGKQIICWITRQGGRPFPQLVQGLAAEGYAVQWVEGPTAPFSVEWFTQNIPADAAAIFLSDTDAKWLTELVIGLRSQPVPQLRFLSICWVGEEKAGALIRRLSDSGVDDIFFPDTRASEIALRLHLRWKEAEQWIKFDLQLKDQVLKMAKSETTLKQREEFLSVCAHDLRSPLGIIQASLSMVLNGTPENPPPSAFHADLLGRAKRQAAHAMSLVKDLLDVMSFEQGLQPQYQLLNLHDLLTEFYKDYSLQAEQKEVRFHYENSVRDWRILADADRIRQLLQNLFTNALKFTEKGKNIFLKAGPFIGRRKNDPPYQMIMISLKDEGKGMPRGEMQKIFDRFSQIKGYSRAEGRGLGLTVAKQISTLHGGNIWVESVEGQGSTFFVLFPDVISRTSALAPRPVAQALVVDPSNTSRDKNFQAIREAGYEVVYAKDGVEALTLIFHLLPEILVLTPGLKKMDEFEVMNIVRNEALTAHIPVFLALEEGQVLLEMKDGSIPFDQTVKLPFSPDVLEKTTAKTRRPPRKKVA